MERELLVYRTFASKEDAEHILLVLEKAGINGEIANNTAMMDAAIAGNGYDDKYIVRIAGPDFEKATAILEESAKMNFEDIDPAHPLFSLDKDELMDVVAKPDEWGPENYNIAKLILSKKGVNMADNIVGGLQEARLEQLSERKTLTPTIFILGYSFAAINILTILAFRHPVIELHQWIAFVPAAVGVVLGRLIIQSKTTLPNGQRIYTYNSAVLRNAVIMQWVSLVVVVVNVIMQVIWMT